MSEEVGLRTQYLNWKGNFPHDLGIEPHWIVVSFNKPGGWIENLPGVPPFIKSRLRAAIEIRQGLKQGPFDATFVAVHSAMTGRHRYLSENSCFSTLDVTPKQLHDFGDFYGKYPSKFRSLENIKHRSRCQQYNSYKGLFPWSHWAANSLTDDYGVPNNKIHVIPPGVDTARWAPTASKSYSQNCEILFVGSDFDRKGGQLLIDWAKETAATNWHLNIVTRKSISIADSRITVHNNLSSNDPRLVELYQSSDIFALPTLADCYSIAGMEALSCGLPVVLSLTGGTGDVIKDGKTGYLLEDLSVSSFDKAVTKLIGDGKLRLEMAVAARQDATERYDAAKNIRRTIKIMLESI